VFFGVRAIYCGGNERKQMVGRELARGQRRALKLAWHRDNTPSVAAVRALASLRL
jgi:hypothetical protein